MRNEIKNNGAATAASDRAAKRSTSPAGEPQQIRYTAKEEKFIRPIAEALRTVYKAGDIIGKHVDALIAAKGGVEYGSETIERIASHPDVNCSAQHLRRCWNLYRFNSAYGCMISPEHKKVCRSARYQIARLLDLEMDVKKMLVIVDECIHHTLKRRLTVDEVRDMVSRRLEEFGKSRKTPKTKKPKVSTTETKVSAKDEHDLIDFADSISYMSDPEMFDDHRISSGDTKRGLTRLISEIVSISRRLPASGPDHNLGQLLINKGEELEEIGMSMLEPEAKPEEVE